MLKIPVECYSRVTGYIRPLDQWNKGKQSEFADRVGVKVKDLNSIRSKNIVADPEIIDK